MPRIETFDAGSLALHPTEVGVDAQAAAARRIGTFYNQQASAAELLGRETERLGSETQQVGRETEQLGSEKGAALRQAGNAIGSGIAAAGDAAVNYLDHQQISHGSAASDNLLMQATQQWNTTLANADPNDPQVAQRFMSGLEDSLQDFKNNGFYTEKSQQWAEAKTAAIRQHFAETTMAGMSHLAGEAVKVNLEQSLNSLSNTVRSDPASIDFALASWNHSLEGQISTSPNLGANAGPVRMEMRQKGAESIVKTAAFGYIEKTGQMPPWASDPKYAPYINGQELKQFEQATRYYQRLGQSESRAQRQEQDYNAKKDFNSKVDALEASTMPTQAGARPQLPQDYWQKLKDLATHPGAALEPGRLKTMVEAGERLTDRLNKPEPIGPVSHQTTIELLNRIRATDASRLQSNDEIYKAYGDGKLNTSDFNFLQREYQDIKTPEGEALNRDRTAFFKNYSTSIVGDLYNPSLGDPKLYNAEQDARRMENMLRQKGLDPHLAYDPSSEYFLGKPERLQKWQQSMQVDLQTRAQGGGAGGGGGNPPVAAASSEPRREVPSGLRGIAALSHNKDWTLFRDDASGKIYNAQGDEVKR